mmetsp:Transcript_88167/g.284738  ORF Transcript_88167/g.284738 Transcript_88167/m.284738 type:complete len:371 (+) Transcript_88167:105-1217(+)
MVALRLLCSPVLAGVLILGAAADVAPALHGAVSQDDACASDGLSGGCAMGLLQHGSPEASRQRQTLQAVPTSMTAAQRSFGGGISDAVVAVPAASGGQALVLVEGSSVNPLDWKMALPGILGRDFSGIVVSVTGQCGVQVGDAVWGDAPSGAWAEYLAVACDLVGQRPTQASALEAGAMPHVALTAQQALAMLGAPWTGSPTVLVLGGSGGVGHLAIQIAKAQGAGKVVTTCSSSNNDFVTSLGADETIDYHTANWWETLGENSVDVVLDTVGIAGTGDHAFEIMRSGGKFVTLLGGSAMASSTPLGMSQTWVRVSQTSTQYLDSLKALVDNGQLKVHIGSTYGLDDVSAAVADSKDGHSVGKISISIAA